MPGVDEVPAVPALADPELAREVVVRGGREAELVVVDLAGPNLEQALVQVGVGRDHDPIGVRGAVSLVEAVPLEHELATRSPARDVVRACRGVDADPLRIDRHARLHRREERHRHLGQEGRVRPGEADRERLTVRDDASNRARLALGARVCADDVVQEGDRRRGLLLVRGPFERPLERRRRDRRAVAEAQAALDRERVGPPVARDAGEAGCIRRRGASLPGPACPDS